MQFNMKSGWVKSNLAVIKGVKGTGETFPVGKRLIHQVSCGSVLRLFAQLRKSLPFFLHNLVVCLHVHIADRGKFGEFVENVSIEKCIFGGPKETHASALEQYNSDVILVFRQTFPTINLFDSECLNQMIE